MDNSFTPEQSSALYDLVLDYQAVWFLVGDYIDGASCDRDAAARTMFVFGSHVKSTLDRLFPEGDPR